MLTRGNYFKLDEGQITGTYIIGQPDEILNRCRGSNKAGIHVVIESNFNKTLLWSPLCLKFEVNTYSLINNAVFAEYDGFIPK